MKYAELQVTSNFSFLRGASHPEELVDRAVELGYSAIAVTDRNTLAGIVRAHVAAREKPIRFIPSCRLDVVDGPNVLAYPTDHAAYTRLCALLSEGNLRTEKGKCLLYKKDLFAQLQGVIVLLLPPARLNSDFEFDQAFVADLELYKEYFGASLYMAFSLSYAGDDQKRAYQLHLLSRRLRVPLVATNDVHYHDAARRQLHDVLTCVREKCTIHSAGYRLNGHAERYLKPIPEIYRLFKDYPEAIENALQVADQCAFSLEELKYIYPEEVVSEGRTPMEELEYLTWKGAEDFFGEDLSDKLRDTLDMELSFIRRKDYASYFLTVHDLVRFARSRGILCQGRGSAANSAVCYCLGITSVNPSKFNLLFARFMSDARNEPPDIDVDFEHSRREEVMQYIYQKYGRHRAGIVATVTQVHWKGAVRDVGKAMGLSVDAVDKLAKSAYELTEAWETEEAPTSEGFDAQGPVLRKVVQLTREYIGFPRQLGQHTGGFVITQNSLSELCPILNARMENRTNIEWNKDDIEALGFLKIDVLALGMLTCIRRAFDLIEDHYGKRYHLATVPQDDAKVYEMISHADTLGVFQIESRAQMSMLPRLRPNNFYDLVIEVAIVRPGPIQGDMVHPYLRRRNGQDNVEYPSPELEAILKRTLGVPLFQEQAMEIAMVAAGFTPDQADALRRSMATFKAKGKVSEHEQLLVSGMMARGYEEEFARRIFRQLEGFGSYGFPESHAASFALLVYISSWIKAFYPDVFAAALLNSQPMGFYAPAQIVIDARKHGVEVRPVDVNASYWDNTLEDQSGGYRAMRLGFRQVKGLQEEQVVQMIAGRKKGFESVNEVFDLGVSIASLERLADADAFRSLGLDRRQALWEVAALSDHPTALFEGTASPSAHEEEVTLPEMSLQEHVFQDYDATALSLKSHPVSFARSALDSLRVRPTADLRKMPNGAMVKVCGLITVRQRPGTAKGVLFITIEDEFGVANLVIWSAVYDKYRKEILQSRLLMVVGVIQVEGEVLHVVVNSCHNMNKLLRVAPSARNIGSVDKSATGGASKEEAKSPSDRRTRDVGEQGDLFKSRDFK